MRDANKSRATAGCSGALNAMQFCERRRSLPDHPRPPPANSQTHRGAFSNVRVCNSGRALSNARVGRDWGVERTRPENERGGRLAGRSVGWYLKLIDSCLEHWHTRRRRQKSCLAVSQPLQINVPNRIGPDGAVLWCESCFSFSIHKVGFPIIANRTVFCDKYIGINRMEYKIRPNWKCKEWQNTLFMEFYLSW